MINVMFIGQWRNWTINNKRMAVILLSGLTLIIATILVLDGQKSSDRDSAGSLSQGAAGNRNPDNLSGRDGLTEQSLGEDGAKTTDSSGSPASEQSPSPSIPSPSPPPSPSPSTTSLSQPTLSGHFGLVNVLAAHSSGTASVSCPAGSVAVGGGFHGRQDSEFWASYKSGNGWFVRANNQSDQSLNLFSRVQCVSNIPGSVNRYANAVIIAANGNGTINRDCPTGQTVLSGGFEGEKMVITFSNKVENGWRVNATNQTSDPRPLTVYANCYSGGTVTVTGSLETADVPAGWTWAKAKACDSGLAVMDGFASSAPTFSSYFLTVSSKWSISVNNQSSSPTTMKAYFYCATF